MLLRRNGCGHDGAMSSTSRRNLGSGVVLASLPPRLYNDLCARHLQHRVGFVSPDLAGPGGVEVADAAEKEVGGLRHLCNGRFVSRLPSFWLAIGTDEM